MCLGPPLSGGSGGFGERKLEDERRPCAQLGLHPDLAVHALDESLADVETEAGAAHASRHLRVEAMELLEDARLIFGRDAEAFVADAEAHGAVLRLEPDLDLPLARRRNSVLAAIDEHLPRL